MIAFSAISVPYYTSLFILACEDDPCCDADYSTEMYAS